MSWTALNQTGQTGRPLHLTLFLLFKLFCKSNVCLAAGLGDVHGDEPDGFSVGPRGIGHGGRSRRTHDGLTEVPCGGGMWKMLSDNATASAAVGRVLLVSAIADGLRRASKKRRPCPSSRPVKDEGIGLEATAKRFQVHDVDDVVFINGRPRPTERLSQSSVKLTHST